MRRDERTGSNRAAARWGLSMVLAFVAVASAWSQDVEQPDEAQADGPRPNIVIYLTDAMRADHLGVYGYTRPTSPTIDALATESVVFDAAYAPASWLLPSLASLLTGKFACEHLVLDEKQTLRSKTATLAERLHGIGYASALFTNTPYGGAISDLKRGFDSFVLEKTISPSAVGAWIESAGDAPLLALIVDHGPQQPYAVEPRFSDPFGEVSLDSRKLLAGTADRLRSHALEDFLAKKKMGTTKNFGKQRSLLRSLDEQKPQAEALYDGAIAKSDASLAELIALLKRQDAWDNTLLIVASATGTAMGEHGDWLESHSVYDELVRVPLIVRFPGSEHAGKRVQAPVTLLDVMPTIAEVVEQPAVSGGARGRSTLPLLVSDRQAEEEMRVMTVRLNRRTYYRRWYRQRGQQNVVVRQGSWKGIWNLVIPSFELYDLARDPGEKDDLSEANGERVEAMREFIKRDVLDCISRATGSLGNILRELDPDAVKILMKSGVLEQKP